MLVGATLFAVKHNIDRFVATLVFHRSWSLFNYLYVEEPTAVAGVSPEAGRLYATLADDRRAVRLGRRGADGATPSRRGPPARVGGALLRAIPQPALLPRVVGVCRRPGPSRPGVARAGERFGTWVPDHPLGSAGFALLVTLPIALAAVVLGVQFLVHYGWGVFVGVPFVVGLGRRPSLTATTDLARSRSASPSRGSRSSCLGAGLLALAIEGMVCLAMAAPIGFVLASLGASVGYAMQRRVGAPAKAMWRPSHWSWQWLYRR